MTGLRLRVWLRLPVVVVVVVERGWAVCLGKWGVEQTKVVYTVFVEDEFVESEAMWYAQLAWLFSRTPFFRGSSSSPGTGLFYDQSQARGSDIRVFWAHAKVRDLGLFLCRDLCPVLRTKVACHLSVEVPTLVVS